MDYIKTLLFLLLWSFLTNANVIKPTLYQAIKASNSSMCPYMKSSPLITSEPDYLKTCTDYQSIIQEAILSRSTVNNILCKLYILNFGILCAHSDNFPKDIAKDMFSEQSLGLYRTKNSNSPKTVCDNLREPLKNGVNINDFAKEIFKDEQVCKRVCTEFSGEILPICLVSAFMRSQTKIESKPQITEHTVETVRQSNIQKIEPKGVENEPEDIIREPGFDQPISKSDYAKQDLEELDSQTSTTNNANSQKLKVTKETLLLNTSTVSSGLNLKLAPNMQQEVAASKASLPTQNAKLPDTNPGRTIGNNPDVTLDNNSNRIIGDNPVKISYNPVTNSHNNPVEASENNSVKTYNNNPVKPTDDNPGRTIENNPDVTLDNNPNRIIVDNPVKISDKPVTNSHNNPVDASDNNSVKTENNNQVETSDNNNNPDKNTDDKNQISPFDETKSDVKSEESPQENEGFAQPPVDQSRKNNVGDVPAVVKTENTDNALHQVENNIETAAPIVNGNVEDNQENINIDDDYTMNNSDGNVVIKDDLPNQPIIKSKPAELNEDINSGYPVSYANENNVEDDSYFFSYFMMFCVIFIGGYIGYHNKQKIVAMLVEGRRGKRQQRDRRRPNSANYHKLDCNLEEVFSSNVNKKTNNIIY